MKKNKKNELNYKIIVTLCLIIIILVFAILFLKINKAKEDKAKNDALTLINMAIHNYIYDKGYNREMAVGYTLAEFSNHAKRDLKCPYNDKSYDKDSSVTLYYDQNANSLMISANLICGRHIIQYDCNTDSTNQPDILCGFSIFND